MRFFSSEFAHNYGTYSFGYCNYCEYEEGDSLSEIYNRGYLPYSGSADVWNTFYMSRSARIVLQHWEPNSENRRILRKHDTEFERIVYKKEQFAVTDDFKEFCLSYFERHHGAHTMPRERFEHILNENALTHIVAYKCKGTLVGYVFLAADERMTHVWFYFYAPEFTKSSCGMWFLLNETRIAQHKGMQHFYIGTVYGDKSKYKTNFSNLEFWDGSTWQQDRNNREMKGRIRNDHLDLIETTDEFKAGKNNFFGFDID
jgi:arginine-tRNA-protein transferase